MAKSNTLRFRASLRQIRFQESILFPSRSWSSWANSRRRRDHRVVPGRRRDRRILDPRYPPNDRRRDSARRASPSEYPTRIDFRPFVPGWCCALELQTRGCGARAHACRVETFSTHCIGESAHAARRSAQCHLVFAGGENQRCGRGRQVLKRKAVANITVEVAAFGVSTQKFPIALRGNLKVEVAFPATEL
jgi:hypothetical protein